MKKIVCLIVSMIFVISLSACADDAQKESNHSVDVKYYASLGQINDLEYKLGAKVDEAVKLLEKTVDDHGDPIYFDYQSGDYTVMTDGGIYCCYKTDAKDEGLTHVVKTGDAYGFAAGAVSTQIRDVMSDFGYEATEREAKRDEIFFLPASIGMTVLEYKIENNTLLFVFQEHYLAATVISK